MEVMASHQSEIYKKVLGVFESVVSQTGLTQDIQIKNIVHDSLDLMRIIVAIENEFNVFLDDIDFIALYDLDIQGFIRYANIG